MKFDFTDGKWEIERNDYGICGLKSIDNGFGLNVIAITNYGDNLEISESNARLITCVTEMIKALIERTIDDEMKKCPKCDGKLLKTYCNECFIHKNISIIERATGKKWSEII